MSIALHSTTGRESLDSLLQRLVSLFEKTFPGRIQSYYLGGSYSDGTAVGDNRSANASDLDLFVIFHDAVNEAEYATFQQLVEECRLISPIQVDAHAYAGETLLQQSATNASQMSFLNMLIRASSQLLYGEDIRAALPAVPFSRYVLDVIESGLFYIGIPRQKRTISYPLPEPLVPPLTYPNAAEEFYGYEVVPARSDAPRGTRVLVGLTAWIATLILALETGQAVGQKSQCVQRCKKSLPDDQRVHLIAAIYDRCKERWGYGLPESGFEREQLRALCWGVLALENDYLRLCRSYLLVQLHQGEVFEQRQAMRVLESVVYSDNEMRAILSALVHADDEVVRSGAAKALQAVERQYS